MKPVKDHGWAQGIYEQSSTRKELIGALRMGLDGRWYRYARAGSSAALSAGKMTHAAQAVAAHLDEAILAAVAIAETQLVLTVTAGTAIAENQLKGGMFQINSGTGIGQQCLIEGNSALTAAGTTINISLEEPIRVALDTTSTFNLIHSPWYGTAESAVGENFATGVTPIAVTASYYYWSQTHGLAICLIHDTSAVGTNLVLSTNTAGAVEAISASVDVDVPIVGVKTHLAGVAADYTAMFLKID